MVLNVHHTDVSRDKYRGRQVRYARLFRLALWTQDYSHFMAHIIFADSDEALCRSAKEALKQCGHTVSLAHDVDEVHSTERTFKADLLITSCQLGSEADVSTMLATIRKGLPVIVMTGGASIQAKSSCTSVIGSLGKPFTVGQLMDTVTIALQGRWTTGLRK